jgi:membrane-associated protein
MIIFSQDNILEWVEALGYFGILSIIFLETGIFFGFMLPGDSLLFAAGLLASKGVFKIWILVPALTIAAFVGYLLGYWFGKKLGRVLIRQNESFWFKKRYLIKTRAYYRRYGAISILFGRLIPWLRTFIPIVAGMTEMPYGKYLFYNMMGAIIWCAGITLLGYYLGEMVPYILNLALWSMILVILFSFGLAFMPLLKKKKNNL